MLELEREGWADVAHLNEIRRQAPEILKVVRELRSEGYRMKLVLIGDTKRMQSIQASPFFTHASLLAREGQGDWTVMKERARKENPDILDVARDLSQMCSWELMQLPP